MTPYPAYVETSEPSLPAIPTHWRLLRVKNVGRALIGLTYDPEDIVDEADEGTLVLRAGNVQDGRLDFTDNVYVKKSIPADLRLRLGDIVVCARNGSARLIGKNAVATIEVAGQTWGAFMAVLRSDRNEYLRWVLNSQIFTAQAGLYSTATINQLTSGTLHNLRFAMPPIDEQRQIANYLDRETARIDTLIEEQQRLIEMLRERRLDLIRSAVLEDANPFAPPEGAEFTAIGHHFSVTLGKMLDAGKEVRAGDQMLPYVRAGNIQDMGLRLDDVNEMPYSETEAANLNLLEGDLLVVEGGAVGTNVLIRGDMPGWSFQKTVNRVRPLADWSCAWLGYVLRTYRDIGVIDIVCNKSTIAHLTAEKLRAMRVPSVEPQEQARVVTLLDRETEKIDALIAETERFIELSRERRSALITAAVTGQIDIREMV